MDTLELISVTNLLLLRHLESDREPPPLLTGYVIYTKIWGFQNVRGSLIYTKKSRILGRGSLIEGRSLFSIGWYARGVEQIIGNSFDS